MSARLTDRSIITKTEEDPPPHSEHPRTPTQMGEHLAALTTITGRKADGPSSAEPSHLDGTVPTDRDPHRRATGKAATTTGPPVIINILIIRLIIGVAIPKIAIRGVTTTPVGGPTHAIKGEITPALEPRRENQFATIAENPVI